MSGTSILDRIRQLAEKGDVLVSTHGLQRFLKRRILFDEIVAGVADGEVIEPYPDAYYGPSVLVLQAAGITQLVHVVWGIEKGTDRPAVIISAYRPNLLQWTPDFRTRLP